MTLHTGNAAVTWTESGGAGTERVFLLPAPLREQVPSHAGFVTAVDSLDLTARDVFTYGSGAYELTTVVRFADDPQGLLDLVRAGAENTTLTLYPDVTDSGVSYTVNLVAPVNAKAIERDAQTAVLGDFQVALRFRQTDQSVFTGTWNKDELFRFKAGGRMDEATVTRASSGSYAAKGYGTVTFASTNTARIHWVRTSTSDQTRSEPALLLESSRTNLLRESSDLTQWTFAGTTYTSGQTDPAGGSNGFHILSNSTSSIGGAKLASTASASTNVVVSMWFRQSSVASSDGTRVDFEETTNAANDAIRYTLTWSSQRPSVAYAAGAAASTPEQWDGGYWRILSVSTGALTSGRSYTLGIAPAGGTTSTGGVYWYGAGVEQ